MSVLNIEIPIYLGLLESKPNSAEVLYELAMTENVLGNSEQSLEFIKRGQAIDSPARPLFYHIQGIQLDQANHPEKALEAFKKSIEIDSTFYLSHYSLAITSLRLGEVENAIPLCLRAP